ncbi:MAG: GNAT family N-acetyltransferase [Bradyrhizobiaceae bacterium]|nr:GNAT family N-acetyltransferase [Bradyrhizobiaceae bacterium]
MEPVVRLATSDDLDGLLRCARAFHAEDGHPLPSEGEAALAALLDANSPYGRAFILEVEGGVAGYAVLCFGYSVEFGGRDAFVDDLYVAPEWRGKNLGDRLMRVLEELARESGCHALHLEVFTGNRMAGWYKSLGFESRGNLMSKRFG